MEELKELRMEEEMEEKLYCPFFKAAQIAAGGPVTDAALCSWKDCAWSGAGEDCVIQRIDYLLDEELDLPGVRDVIKVRIVDDDTRNRFYHR